MVSALDDTLAGAISRNDWTRSGEEFGKAISKLLSGDAEDESSDKWSFVDKWPVAIAIRFILAIGQSETWKNINTAIENFFNGLTDPIADAAEEWAKSAAQGFIDGANEIELNINQWVFDKIITPVKRALGIASPSSVFFGIGQDVVRGLINGISSMFSSLSTAVGNMFDEWAVIAHENN